MTFGSLFAGIGGFDLGFERSGMVCKWQVEIDPWCRQVLAKHWPDVRRHDDIRTFPPAGDWSVDVICGGFPCQDISVAGNGRGLAGERSGLFFEFMRVVSVLEPRVVVLENVAALLARGMDTVLGNLSELGFNAEWSLIPSCSMGAPHSRARVFIVAYRHEERRVRESIYFHREDGFCTGQWNGKATPSSGEWGEVERWLSETFQDGDWESPETKVQRMDDGLPPWLDRNGMCGNAVVPQVAEWIGKRIMESQPAVVQKELL